MACRLILITHGDEEHDMPRGVRGVVNGANIRPFDSIPGITARYTELVNPAIPSAELTEEQLAIFKRITSSRDATSLAPADIVLATQCAVLESKITAAWLVVEQDGMVIANGEKTVAHPLLASIPRLNATLLSMLRMLGLSAANRNLSNGSAFADRRVMNDRALRRVHDNLLDQPLLAQ